MHTKSEKKEPNSFFERPILQYDKRRHPLCFSLQSVDGRRFSDVMGHPQLSIVIPAFNESARIEDALGRVMSCVAEQGWDAEVLVVDDGSTDDTAVIVQ